MNIAILLYDGFTALDAFGPHEILCHLPGYTAVFVAAENRPITNDSGTLTVIPKCSIDELPNPEILLIPGGLTGATAAMGDERILNWVRNAHETTQWTISVCSGALILGAAGILNGLEVTTHFMAKDILPGFGATYTPQRYVYNGKIVTAAGVSAGIDMALDLAAKIAGEEFAKVQQLGAEYDPQPPFDCGSPEKAGPDILAKTIEWCANAMAGA